MLSLILPFKGGQSYSAQRNIPLFSFMQFLSVILLFNLSKNSQSQYRIFLVLLLVFLFEVFIVLGQFTFISFGFGLQPPLDSAEYEGLITGSLGNPNNSATLIGLLTLSTTAYLIINKKFYTAYLILIISLTAIFLTLSRTMLTIWALNLIAVIISNKNYNTKHDANQYNKWLLLFAPLIVISIITTAYLSLNIDQSDVYLRSIERVISLSDAENDESINFRLTSHIRLVENITNLGFGSLSDLNYSNYFESYDPWLMKVNPHSYIAEFSFLFGLPGLVSISSIFIFLFHQIINKSKLNFSFKALSCFALFFSQSVPSSLVNSVYFFIPFVYIWLIKKQVY